MQKKAFITGITGQDGSYLAELLLEKGYKVYGLSRRTSTQNFARISHVINDIEIVSGDLIDQHSLTNAIQLIKPDEVYNLAAQSFVQASWEQPVLTGEFTALGVVRMLEAVKLAHPKAKFYQASSSEMFGKVIETPQKETTPFYPRSPYGVAKVYGHWITVNYRESFNMHAIQELLKEVGADVSNVEINNEKYSINSQSPETYLGYDRTEGLASPEEIVLEKPTLFTAPETLSLNEFSLLGNWTFSHEYAKPSRNSELEFHFKSQDVFLVMKPKTAGTIGKVEVYLDDQLVRTINLLTDVDKNGIVTIDKDRLYTLFKFEKMEEHTLKLKFLDDNVEAFAFTFG